MTGITKRRQTFGQVLREARLAKGITPRKFAEMVGPPKTADQWQTEPLLVNPPCLAVIAAVVLAELHGRRGYFPPVARHRPVDGAAPRASRSRQS